MTSAAREHKVETTDRRELPRLDDIRVLVLFGGERLFGQERSNIEVFRSLAELGLKARFVISSRWGHTEIQPELEKFGFEWTTAPFGYQWTRYMLTRHLGYFFLNLWSVVAASWRVWREAQRWKPTHVYVANWIHLTYALPFVLLSRLPLVYRAGDEVPTGTAVHRLINRILLHRVRRLVCNCRFLADRLRASIPGCSPAVIYNRPPQRRAGAPTSLPPAPAGAAVVLYVGQIAEHKGVPLLIDAVRGLIGNGFNAVLWLAGDCPWSEEFGERLLSEVSAAGLAERIQFLGYVSDVFGLFISADIHVCPSLWNEPSPNVVFEAKAAGVPSVVFPVGGIPELVEHGMDGYLCPDTTGEALAKGIRYFLEDPVARQRAGESARRSLESKFGQERFQREWAEVFLSTLLPANPSRAN